MDRFYTAWPSTLDNLESASLSLANPVFLVLFSISVRLPAEVSAIVELQEYWTSTTTELTKQCGPQSGELYADSKVANGFVPVFQTHQIQAI